MDYDVIIIGAGLAGATTAYYLGARSRQHGTSPPRVLLVEKEVSAGEHSSGRNAALVRGHLEDPVLAALAERGADVLASGELASFRRTGSVLVGLGDDSAATYFPLARGRCLWCPADGVVDVAGLLTTYLHGQAVRYATEVIGWDDAPPCSADNGRPRLRVHTTRGELLTRVVVNAAGPWAGALGTLPLTPTNRHLFVTPPMATIRPDWPFIWDIPHGLYLRPESGGLLLCAGDETPAAPGVYEEDPQVAARLADLVRNLQPRLGAVRIMRSWVGQRTFAADRRFVIGFDPRDRRVFHVAALGGHGVTTSPAVGALAADLLLGRRLTLDNPLDPARILNVAAQVGGPSPKMNATRLSKDLAN